MMMPSLQMQSPSLRVCAAEGDGEVRIAHAAAKKTEWKYMIR